MWGGVPDLITPVKFDVDWFRGFRSPGGAKNRGVPLTRRVALTTVLHYRADCDVFEYVSDSGLGCTIKRYCMSIFMYADDMILLSQCPFNVCFAASLACLGGSVKLVRYVYKCQ